MIAMKSIITRAIAAGRDQHGVTLIELLIVLTMIGLITSAAFGVLSLGNQAYHRGELQSGIQNNLQRTGDFITAELRNASLVRIEGAVPEAGTFTPGRKYIYLSTETRADGKTYTSVCFYYAGTTTIKLDGFTSLQQYDLVFKREKEQRLYIKLKAQNETQTYEFDTKLNLPNVDDIELTEGATTGDGGMVISYTSDTNQIYYFQFIKTGSGTTLATAPAIIDPDPDNPTITAYIPNSVDLSKGLVAKYATTGSGISAGGTPLVSEVTSLATYQIDIPVVITSLGRNGGNVNYILTVKRAASMVNWVQINKDSKVLFYKSQDNLVGDYKWNSGANTEGRSIREWWVSADDINWRLAETNVRTYVGKPLRHQVKSSYTGINTDQFYIKLKITPVDINGVQGEPVDYYYAPDSLDPAKLVMTYNTVVVNNSMKTFMRDLSNQSDVLLRTDYNPDTSLNFNVNDVTLLIKARSDNANGGSSLMKSLVGYVTDLNSYSIVVDAQIQKSNDPGGYGILLNGDVDTSDHNKDTGYMLQFDPGANSFLIRKINDGTHDASVSFGATPINKDGAGVQGVYPPPSFKNNMTFSNSKSANEWYKRYQTQVTIQVQEPNKDMIVRVRIKDPATGKISNDMWFGDFGQIQMPNRDYTGVEPNKAAGMKDITTNGDYFGIRSWTNGVGADVKFYDINTYSYGFALYAKSQFISQNQIKVTFDTYDNFISNNLLSAWFEAENIDPNKIKLVINGEIKTPIAAVAVNPVTRNSNNRKVSQTLLLTLDPGGPIPTIYELSQDGARGAMEMQKGAVRQQYAGTVSILCRDEDGIGNDITKPTYSYGRVNNNDRIYDVTFSEPMQYDYSQAGVPAVNTLDDPMSYTSSISGQHPQTVAVISAQPWGPTKVRLTFAANQSIWTTINLTNTIEDVAGNSVVP